MSQFPTNAPWVNPKTRARRRENCDPWGSLDDHYNTPTPSSSRRERTNSDERERVRRRLASPVRDEPPAAQDIKPIISHQETAQELTGGTGSQSLLTTLQGMKLFREVHPEQFNRRASFLFPGQESIIYTFNTTKSVRETPIFDTYDFPDSPRMSVLTQPQVFPRSYAWTPLTPLLPTFEVASLGALHYRTQWPTKRYIEGYALRMDLISEWVSIESQIVSSVHHLLKHGQGLPDDDPRRRISDIMTLPEIPVDLGYTRAHRTEELAQHRIRLAHSAFRLWLGLLYFELRLFSERVSIANAPTPQWYRVLNDAGIPESYLNDFYQASVFAAGSARVGAIINVEDVMSEGNRVILRIYLDAEIPLYYQWPDRLSQGSDLEDDLLFQPLIPPKSLQDQKPILSLPRLKTLRGRLRMGILLLCCHLAHPDSWRRTAIGAIDVTADYAHGPRPRSYAPSGVVAPAIAKHPKWSAEDEDNMALVGYGPGYR
ncbi:hypothetical protein SISNIDRAFT_527469 [Sistotremastrum niveocremeum HHB9708]|uniref:Uncharacterized protein n=1 Tax=Sistotremastrum niveocremeum HHB9708 TaxID=1314777 RepID=A0A164PZ83_9AGAM|nr:hypothetical protein SISNIDRAFT_527469 [Sistotremastrum niveocremeum HHB9708]